MLGAIAAVRDKGISAMEQCMLQNYLECLERSTLGLCTAWHKARSRSLRFKNKS